MNNKKIILASAVMLVAMALIISSCGKKTQTNTNTTPANTNVVVTEAPYTMSGSTKVFTLKLVNGMLNYKTMTFHAGDSIQVNLTSDGQPVDFEFKGTGAKSTSGVFSTMISNTDSGGTYQLSCVDRDCGGITLTVIPLKTTNTNTNTNNAVSNTNSQSGITKVELQRLPAGTAFSPNVNMSTTATFEVGDQMGFGVTGIFNSGDKLTFAITDANGNTVIGQGLQKDLITGTNGSCCFGLPSSAGSYNVQFYVNGVLGESVPITMTKK